MSKYFAPILTVVIVAALAGILYIRANVARPDAAVPEAAPESATDLSVQYAIRSTDGTVEIRSFHPGSGTTVVVDPSTLGLLWPARYNQSAYICATADELTAPTALRVMCDIGRDDTLLLAAYDGDKKVVTVNIDPRDVGVMPSAAEGYLVPVAVADDKSAVYLGRRVETESWVAGLWKLDVATGEVSEVAYVREHNLYQYDINPATKQLLGVTFVPPESLGEYMTAPTSVHLVDLVTGEGEQLYGRNGGLAFENPMLSDDVARYAFYAADPLDPGTTVMTIDGREPIHIDGVMKDWFGDTVVFDRDGNLFLSDLKTDTETQITHETDATVEYVGVVR